MRVCGTGAAQLAVARLHRRRVAGRRLLLSLAPPPAPTSLPLLRLQVASLLQVFSQIESYLDINNYQIIYSLECDNFLALNMHRLSFIKIYIGIGM